MLDHSTSSGMPPHAARPPLFRSVKLIVALLALVVTAAGCRSAGVLDPSAGGGEQIGAATTTAPAGDGEPADAEATDGEATDSAADDGEADDGEAADGEAGDGPTGDDGSTTTSAAPSLPTVTSTVPTDDTSAEPPSDDATTTTTDQPQTTVTTPSTTARSTTTTRPAPTTAPPTMPAETRPATGGAKFETLPPGASLPSGAECAARVKPAAETKASNADENATRGTSSNGRYPRVDGNFTGTTDEIIQWAACKWGIDEDIARAQVAVESWWRMSTRGDFNADQSTCYVTERTSSGTCPESVGLMQVRWLYHQEAFEDGNALRSSAYNVDYAYAVWRECYDGKLTWLNNVERNGTYRAGDLQGCLGVWVSGRWYTERVGPYLDKVNSYLADRVWETAAFKEG